MINIKLLGSVQLSNGSSVLSENDNRSKKMWILLGYLILNRHRYSSPDDIVSILWEDKSKVTNTVSAVKTTVHRLRAMLDTLGYGMGKDLISFTGEGYKWNTDIPFTLDTEEFKALAGSSSIDDRLKALEIYENDLLVKYLGPNWLKPLVDTYHQLYIDTVKTVSIELISLKRFDDAASICSKAVSIEPLDEDIYCMLMKSYIMLGKANEAVRLYEKMSGIFIETYGIVPSDKVRAVYREALDSGTERILPLDSICSELMEPSAASGAFLLEYDLFKTIFQSYYRAADRIKEHLDKDIVIAMFTVRAPLDRKLQERSINVAVENLLEQILGNIRKSDLVTKCSSTQYLILLPAASYDNGIMVCERIKSAFFRQYPHSPVELHFSVLPIKQ